MQHVIPRIPSPPRRRSRWQCWALLTTWLLLQSAGTASAQADQPSGAARYQIDQPAQPMGDALHAIARRTGHSVLFDPGAVNGRMAGALSGHFSAAEAITRVLRGSGLVLAVMPDGSIVVRAATRPSAQTGSGVSADDRPVVVAAAGAAASDWRTDPAAGTGDRSDAGSSGAGAGPRTERVEVTGSRLRRVHTDGALPINVYTREDIARSGQPSLERFLSTLNEASMAPGEGAFGTLNGQGSVQLRGLPVGSTLVLINGRRVQAVGSSTANIFNLNLIPLAAVERVEIVPVGSSAVYGGDALAGVVNIILRSRIDGLSLNLRTAAGRGFGDGSVALASGGTVGEVSYTVLGSYSKTSPLYASERGFFRDADYRDVGGRDGRSRNCTPGTVSSASGTNLPGLGAPVAGIPVLAAGQSLSAASFLGTAGQPNLCGGLANANGSALVYGNESVGLHASAHAAAGAIGTVFGELSFSRDRMYAREAGLLLNNQLVAAGNPYNPFGVPVRVTARLGPANGTEGIVRRTNFSRALLGLRGEWGAQWDFELTGSSTRDDGDRLLFNGTANAAARTAALGSTNLATALNPFTTGVAAPESVLRGIWTDAPRENSGRRDQLGGFMRGALWQLPAGAVEVILGGEAAQDRYAAVVPGTTVENQRRSRAVYGETRLPLWRAGGAGVQGWNLVALTLAARRDRYAEFGDAGTHQAGLELRPKRDLLLRASLSTSFKPPTLLQTSVDDLSLPLSTAVLVDPARGNESITSGELLRATNPNLQPESGKAWAAGAVWEPGAGGTRLAVNAWRVKIDGLIALLTPQLILDNEALFPGFVTRAAPVGGVPGRVNRVLWAEVNFGGVDTSGVDIEASHSWATHAGRWMLGASGTRATRYDVSVAPGAPVVDRLGKRFIEYWAPEWKGRVTASFDGGVWSLGLGSRNLGRYQDQGASQRALGAFWVHDLSAQLKLARLGWRPGGARDATLALSVVNLGDRQPQLTDTSPFFDASQADWRGRTFGVRLSMDW